MSIRNALASVAVRNIQAATGWYEQLLGKSASRPMPEVAEWRFDRGGSLQVYELAERAGSGSFTLIVDDIEEHAEKLRKLHIEMEPRVSSRTKVIMINDPDGNSIAFSQPLDETLAH